MELKARVRWVTRAGGVANSRGCNRRATRDLALRFSVLPKRWTIFRPSKRRRKEGDAATRHEKTTKRAHCGSVEPADARQVCCGRASKVSRSAACQSSRRWRASDRWYHVSPTVQRSI